MRRTIQGLAVLAVMASCVAMARGGAVGENRVAADAKWVVQADVPAFLRTQAGLLLKQECQKPASQQKLAWVKDTFGMDPLTDLAGLTVYGTTFEQGRGVLLARGTFDGQKLASLVARNPSYEKQEYDGRAIHTWTDARRDRPQAGCLYADDLLVVARTAAEVKAAIDVLGGKAAHLRAGFLPAAPAGAAVVMAAEGQAGALGDNPHARMPRSCSRLAFWAAESAGNAMLTLSLTADTEDNAVQLEQLANGMLAFSMLGKEQNPSLAELASAVKIARSGLNLTASMTYPAARLVEQIQACKDMPGPHQRPSPGGTPAPQP